MEMMPALLPSEPVGIMAGCREDPLPPPLFLGIPVRARKRIGSRDAVQRVVRQDCGCHCVVVLSYYQSCRHHFYTCCRGNGLTF